MQITYTQFETIEMHENVRYLDVWSKFCDASRCIFKNSNGLLFFDAGHLSAYGARYAVEGIALLPN